VPNEYVSGSQIVYVRNPDYVPRQRSASGFAGGKRVFVDRVEFRIIPDPATAAALGKGEIDLWEAPPLDLLALLRSQPLTTTRFLKTGGLMLVMRPNHLLPPFNDMHACLALLAMVNQDDFMAVASRGDAGNMRACHAFLGCSTDARTEAGIDNFLRPDLARARALLRESGYDGRPIVPMQPTNLPLICDASAVAKQVMEQVGFKVDMQTMDWATLVQRRAKQDPVERGGGTCSSPSSPTSRSSRRSATPTWMHPATVAAGTAGRATRS
jgi:peptide/nickel transport system substrate-binding protein